MVSLTVGVLLPLNGLGGMPYAADWVSGFVGPAVLEAGSILGGTYLLEGDRVGLGPGLHNVTLDLSYRIEDGFCNPVYLGDAAMELGTVFGADIVFADVCSLGVWQLEGIYGYLERVVWSVGPLGGVGTKVIHGFPELVGAQGTIQSLLDRFEWGNLHVLTQGEEPYLDAGVYLANALGGNYSQVSKEDLDIENLDPLVRIHLVVSGCEIALRIAQEAYRVGRVDRTAWILLGPHPTDCDWMTSTEFYSGDFGGESSRNLLQNWILLHWDPTQNHHDPLFSSFEPVDKIPSGTAINQTLYNSTESEVRRFGQVGLYNYTYTEREPDSFHTHLLYDAIVSWARSVDACLLYGTEPIWSIGCASYWLPGYNGREREVNWTAWSLGPLDFEGHYALSNTTYLFPTQDRNGTLVVPSSIWDDRCSEASYQAELHGCLSVEYYTVEECSLRTGSVIKPSDEVHVCWYADKGTQGLVGVLLGVLFLALAVVHLWGVGNRGHDMVAKFNPLVIGLLGLGGLLSVGLGVSFALEPGPDSCRASTLARFFPPLVTLVGLLARLRLGTAALRNAKTAKKRNWIHDTKVTAIEASVVVLAGVILLVVSVLNREAISTRVVENPPYYSLVHNVCWVDEQGEVNKFRVDSATMAIFFVIQSLLIVYGLFLSLTALGSMQLAAAVWGTKQRKWDIKYTSLSVLTCALCSWALWLVPAFSDSVQARIRLDVLFLVGSSLVPLLLQWVPRILFVAIETWRLSSRGPTGSKSKSSEKDKIERHREDSMIPVASIQRQRPVSVKISQRGPLRREYSVIKFLETLGTEAGIETSRTSVMGRCPEVVDCVVEILQFEKNPIFDRYMRICETYIEPDSPHQVNLNGAVAKGACTYCKRRNDFFAMSEEFRSHLFDVVMQECIILLRGNTTLIGLESNPPSPRADTPRSEARRSESSPRADRQLSIRVEAGEAL